MVLTVIDALPSSSLHKGTRGTAMALFATCNCTIRENLICALTSPHESLKTDSNLGENNPSVVERSLFFPRRLSALRVPAHLFCFVGVTQRRRCFSRPSWLNGTLEDGGRRMEGGGWASTNRKGPDHAPVCFVYSKIALPAFFLSRPPALFAFICHVWSLEAQGCFRHTVPQHEKQIWLTFIVMYLSRCLSFIPLLIVEDLALFRKRLSPFSNGGTLSDSYGSRAVVTSTFAADVSGVTAKPFKCKEDSVPLSGINTPLIWTDNLWLPALLFDGISHLKETQGSVLPGTNRWGWTVEENMFVLETNKENDS